MLVTEKRSVSFFSMFRINILLHCFFLQLGLREKNPIPKAERQHFNSQPLFHFTFNALEWNQSASPSQSFVTVPYIFPTVNSRPAITLPSILISNQFNFSGGKKRDVTWLLTVVFINHRRTKKLSVSRKQ